jgi:hypothetical protein
VAFPQRERRANRQGALARRDPPYLLRLHGGILRNDTGTRAWRVKEDAVEATHHAGEHAPVVVGDHRVANAHPEIKQTCISNVRLLRQAHLTTRLCAHTCEHWRRRLAHVRSACRWRTEHRCSSSFVLKGYQGSDKHAPYTCRRTTNDHAHSAETLSARTDISRLATGSSAHVQHSLVGLGVEGQHRNERGGALQHVLTRQVLRRGTWCAFPLQRKDQP